MWRIGERSFSDEKLKPSSCFLCWMVKAILVKFVNMVQHFWSFNGVLLLIDQEQNIVVHSCMQSHEWPIFFLHAVKLQSSIFLWSYYLCLMIVHQLASSHCLLGCLVRRKKRVKCFRKISSNQEVEPWIQEHYSLSYHFYHVLYLALL